MKWLYRLLFIRKIKLNPAIFNKLDSIENKKNTSNADRRKAARFLRKYRKNIFLNNKKQFWSTSSRVYDTNII